MSVSAVEHYYFLASSGFFFVFSLSLWLVLFLVGYHSSPLGDFPSLSFNKFYCPCSWPLMSVLHYYCSILCGKNSRAASPADCVRTKAKENVSGSYRLTVEKARWIFSSFEFHQSITSKMDYIWREVLRFVLRALGLVGSALPLDPFPQPQTTVLIKQNLLRNIALP